MVPAFVSQPSAKTQEPVAEVEGLLFSPQNSQLVYILCFCFYGVVSTFIFPTCPTTLDSEPYGRDTSKIRDTTGSVLIQSPSIVLPIYGRIMFNGSSLIACRSVQIVQKITFSHLESWQTESWCLGSVSQSRPSAKAQEPVAQVEGLLFSPQNSQLVHILCFHS